MIVQLEFLHMHATLLCMYDAVLAYGVGIASHAGLHNIHVLCVYGWYLRLCGLVGVIAAARASGAGVTRYLLGGIRPYGSVR